MSEALPAASLPWVVGRAQRDPDALALRDGTGSLSWNALALRVERLAARLTALGIRPGDRVALLMETSCRMVELMHATQRCYATVVPLNTRLAAREIAAVIADAEPRLVIHDRGSDADLGRSSSQACRLVGAGHELDAVASVDPPPLRRLDPAALHTLVYTSGTTGAPKGVMLTHGNHAASAAASRTNLGVCRDDQWLAALPLSHVGGLSMILRGVLDGVPVTLQPGFDPERVSATLRSGEITLLSMVPTMLLRLLDHDDTRPFPPSLRAVLIGGAPAPATLLARARDRGLPVLPTYGLTETASQVATAAPAPTACPPTAVGRALPGTDIRIDAPDARGWGEIVVRGPTVMAGYFRNPEATAAALRDGWLRSGDLGHIDADGFLHVLDRRTDLIITGGENVYPAEVEAVLAEHPDVREAAVYGRPHPVWGQEVAATIVVRDGQALDAEALSAWCRTRLAGYKIPRSFQHAVTLPRTPSGKLRRNLLTP
jgi:O-succinylbenzoic acid--CoA ligase